MEWHVEAGMRATFIEAPTELQKLGIKIPDDHLAICKAQNIPTAGNCAGNTKAVLDTSACNNDPKDDSTWGSVILFLTYHTTNSANHVPDLSLVRQTHEHGERLLASFLCHEFVFHVFISTFK